MSAPWTARLERLVWWGVAVIIVGLPFHVLGYSLLHLHAPALSQPFRDWYSALTLVLDAAAAALLLVKAGWRMALRRADLWLIAAFTLLNAVFMLFTPGIGAALLAVKVNVVFLLLYAAASLVGKLGNRQRRWLVAALLVPAGLVGLFGLLQFTFLPHDILTHVGFGYGPDQIRPFELIQNSSILRVQSIMFGPNQYGSYLALPIILAAWLAATPRRIRVRLGAGLLTALLLVNLYATQSRGSWLGTLAGLIVLVWLLAGKRGRLVLAGCLAALALGAALALPNLSHGHWSYILRHNSPGSVTASDSTDVLHYQRLRQGISLVARHPWGEGLTAAGRASDLTGQSFYTENFYLQIADQVGIEGLLLFCAIIAAAASALWRQPEGLSVPLLAALAGLSVMNLFSHTWSDAATALLWWGAAGLTVGEPHRD